MFTTAIKNRQKSHAKYIQLAVINGHPCRSTHNIGGSMSPYQCLCSPFSVCVCMNVLLKWFRIWQSPAGVTGLVHNWQYVHFHCQASVSVSFLWPIPQVLCSSPAPDWRLVPSTHHHTSTLVGLTCLTGCLAWVLLFSLCDSRCWMARPGRAGTSWLPDWVVDKLTALWKCLGKTKCSTSPKEIQQVQSKDETCAPHSRV